MAGGGGPETIPHRDLRNRSAEILRAVQAGASFQITNHGEVVALLSPPHRQAYGGLQVRSPRADRNFAGLQPPVRISQATADVLDELRDER